MNSWKSEILDVVLTYTDCLFRIVVRILNMFFLMMVIYMQLEKNVESKGKCPLPTTQCAHC